MLTSELVYTRAGGFVGTNDRIVIQPDGTLQSSGRLVGEHRRKLSASELEQLVAALREWPRWEVKGEPPPASDAFEYTLTYAGRTLRWNDASTNVPEALKRLTAQIQKLAANEPPGAGQ